MPYVNIRVAGKLDREQKEEICRGVTDVISRVARKP
ncbi:MAG: tautomerase family protein, partial [Desulfobulbales bacterium]